LIRKTGRQAGRDNNSFFYPENNNNAVLYGVQLFTALVSDYAGESDEFEKVYLLYLSK
jgi:hypothetical protein